MLHHVLVAQLRLVDLFKRFDANGDGVISREEFVQGVMDSGIDLSGEKVNQMMKNVDKDNSGSVDYRELAKFRSKVKTAQASAILTASRELMSARQGKRGAEILKGVKVDVSAPAVSWEWHAEHTCGT
eukprot:TRINITY_DN11870_c0_g2_i5.p3 TRINITY_DN11870_c0_g2~~TRINITY_DN11870_c0_g2_i5.p3  ORF type:complete len:128 (+),score=36.46 TRINITY_DN11870_c0_g2_i5:2650-3033(+)